MTMLLGNGARSGRTGGTGTLDDDGAHCCSVLELHPALTLHSLAWVLQPPYSHPRRV